MLEIKVQKKIIDNHIKEGDVLSDGFQVAIMGKLDSNHEEYFREALPNPFLSRIRNRLN